MTPRPASDLPPAIRDFFAGRNARDFARAVSGFAASAVVRDEGHDHVGPAAIRAWIETTAARYDDTAEIRGAASDGHGVEVVAAVSGNFPGSPLALRFTFALDGGRISRLAIAA